MILGHAYIYSRLLPYLDGKSEADSEEARLRATT
jgi:hypothetical protein